MMHGHMDLKRRVVFYLMNYFIILEERIHCFRFKADYVEMFNIALS